MCSSGKPLVSVIIPIYNAERFLVRCVESIQAQSYGSMEIILVNDGSTDGSMDICEEMSKDDHRIKIINKTNEGPSSARNAGIKMASGVYIAFIDADDYVKDTYIQDMIDPCIEKKLDFCISGYHSVNEDGRELGSSAFPAAIYNQNIRSTILLELLGTLPDQSAKGILYTVWGKMFRKELIQKYKIFFRPEKEILSEDYVFIIEYVLHSSKIEVIKELNYFYVSNTDSYTRKYRPDMFEEIKGFYLFMQELIENNGLNEEAVIRMKKTILIHLRYCIAQERHRISRKRIWDAGKAINAMCRDKFVEKLLDQYPCRRLKKRQKIFVYLIRHKKILLLYFGS